jgi:hypothetical protein
MQRTQKPLPLSEIALVLVRLDRRLTSTVDKDI